MSCLIMAHYQKDDVVGLLQRVFEMCDVNRQGHICIEDLVQLGKQYLDADNQVACDYVRLVVRYITIGLGG